MGVCVRRHTLCHFNPWEEIRHPSYVLLGVPRGRFGWIRQISSTSGFEPQTVQPVASYPGPQQSSGFREFSEWPSASRLSHTSCLFGGGNERLNSSKIMKMKLLSTLDWSDIYCLTQLSGGQIYIIYYIDNNYMFWQICIFHNCFHYFCPSPVHAAKLNSMGWLDIWCRNVC